MTPRRSSWNRSVRVPDLSVSGGAEVSSPGRGEH